MNKSLARIADALGLELMPKWRMQRLGLARHLARLFQLYGIRSVLDVGANTGQYRDFLRREVGFDGLIISFEPISDVFQALAARASSDPRWKVLNCALGEVEEQRVLNVMEASDLTSFLRPKADGPQYRKNVVVREETVAVRRLDAIVSELEGLGMADGVYLKLDTQGYDLKVVEGAGAFLQRVRALQTEAAVVAVYEGAQDFLVHIPALKAKGYDISGFFPVASDDRLRLIEFDCVMVKASSCSATEPSG